MMNKEQLKQRALGGLLAVAGIAGVSALNGSSINIVPAGVAVVNKAEQTAKSLDYYTKNVSGKMALHGIVLETDFSGDKGLMDNMFSFCQGPDLVDITDVNGGSVASRSPKHQACNGRRGLSSPNQAYFNGG